jgi:hypothetical protein
MQFSRLFRVSVLAAIMPLVGVVPSINAQARPTKPAATPPVANSPSLDETLKWLTEFLPGATGATQKMGSAGFQSTITLQVINSCRVSLAVEVVLINDLSRPSGTYRHEFSLSDIDPKSVVMVKSDTVIWVELKTKNGLNTIIQDSRLPDPRADHIQFGNFTDSGSADRVVKAFKHAAELCANTQPF